MPLTSCVLDVGPRDSFDFLGIPRRVRAGEIRSTWPQARLPDELARTARDAPDTEVDLLEAVERDWTARNQEVWHHRVIWKGGETDTLYEERMEGVGSCPFVAPSFTRAAGEVMGRGPILMALPDIRTANKLRELQLEATDLALSGIWQAEDDGVINVDTAYLEPGVIIPIASGSKGLQNVAPNLNLNAGAVELDGLRAQIKEALYVNDLGDITKTPKTATEIAQRTADRARRLSGTYGRLLTEFLFPLVSRVWWLRRRDFGIDGVPPVDGDRIRVRPLSPLTRAQAQDDVLRNVNYAQTLNALFGQQAALLILDDEAFPDWLADRMGANPLNLRTKEERKKLVANALQIAQQQMGAAPAGQPAAVPA